MKLGAQLYSVRNALKTEPDVRETFDKIRRIGYDNVQLSGNAQMDPHIFLEASQENGLPIVCTHSPYKRIIGDTEELIREHKVMNCPVVGLGSMPKEFRGDGEGLTQFLKELDLPVKKILDAGLRFAYHNHDFEFSTKAENGMLVYDEMLRVCADWNFIMDTYWVEFAGFRAVDYIAKIGKGRLTDIHYKDMARDENRSICSCGSGCMDFESITRACEEIGVRNVLVEQDNAVDMPDPFGEMENSFRHLRPIIR